jgi:hypothetical protein
VLERFSAMLREDMDVIDANGDKVGKIGTLYQPTTGSSTASTVAEPTGRAYMQVDTGFLGLGKHFYIPADAIGDVTGERVFLTTDKDHFAAMGWDHQPDFLRDYLQPLASSRPAAP